jgi:WS/DGAT/MGAT family acyltransferase
MTEQPVERLTPVDLINIHAETPSAPARVGALALLDGRTLLDSHGHLRIAEIRTLLESRIGREPRLRQKIRRAGPLAGRPVWVDDPDFRIERHVLKAEPLAGETAEELALRLVNQPMPQSHPLWRVWFVTGLPERQVGLVVGLHHVIADGVTTVRLIGALTDGESGDPVPAWSPREAPPWARLVRDNWRRKASAVRAWRCPDLSQWREMSALRNAPRTTLNRPVGARRRLAVLTMDLASAKHVAHAHGGKINDLVLAVAAGGLRQLLRGRRELVDGMRLNASVAVSLRGSRDRDVGNRSGGIVVRVPLDADPHGRLRTIADESAQAKQRQRYTAGSGLLVALARLGVLRMFSRHQHMVNFVESNVPGPAFTLTLLGAPIVDVIPIGTLVGNLTVGVLALSYAGRLTIAAQADAVACPDLPIMLAAMDRDSRELGIDLVHTASLWARS